ncbi:MAG: hypothetical protein IKR50_07455 [Prevotella sp.]|nr:hypothetical protein [Prevotella sp.]
MNNKKFLTYRLTAVSRLLAVALVALAALQVHAQAGVSAMADSLAQVPDSLVQALDSLYEAMPKDTAVVVDGVEQGASLVAQQAVPKGQGRDWSKWRPNPQKALWLALVIPGGGQIYNRKYWKLPIVYGGFLGCIYALSWNNMMYKDYAQAYRDLEDNDPTTNYFKRFEGIGRQINDQTAERYKTIFKSRRDRYRRYRDLSFFVMLGIYAVSVIDAYVDAELSEFDISKDLSLKVSPAVINNGANRNPLYATALGVNCSINF